ncbi:MAG: NrpR regulatory domain-containing protein [Spirochaetota bacterium]
MTSTDNCIQSLAMNKRQITILTTLKNADGLVTSPGLTDALLKSGLDASERTVRYYLSEMEKAHLVKKSGKRGYAVTERGLSELKTQVIVERIGFLSAKIDQMTYRMDFDLARRKGTVVVNITVVEPAHIGRFTNEIEEVYRRGFAMGERLVIIPPGEKIGEIVIPAGSVGMGTVCSITLNGVLLKYGVPTNSKFGGLMQIQNRKPIGFIDVIMYDGTSIDPLEVFIRSGMTNYTGAITKGTGRIGASFREFPAASAAIVKKIARELVSIGLGGFLEIGRPNQPLFNIPVSEGRVGAVVIGGLNPVSIFEENGIRLYSQAFAGLIDYDRLFHYSELAAQIKKFL